MDKKEINQLFGERIMGLVPGADFGEWTDHEWRRDEDGDIDEFFYDSGHHNGPGCTRCGYSYCAHCRPEPAEPCEKEVPDYSGSVWYIPRIIKKLHELDDELDIRFGITYSKELGDFKPRVTIVDGNPNYRGASAGTYEEALVMAALRWKGVLE